jgi:hypothetical protein
MHAEWRSLDLRSESSLAMVTLDDALSDATPPSLVKLDPHGVEAEILAGAARPLVVLCPS